MYNLYYQLHVLSKLITYKNISSAQPHVGLSQPQLSRIIKKIEDDLGVTLLDRSAKRKSSWTKTAYELSETFLKNQRRMELELQQISHTPETRDLYIGTLEGLSHIALELTKLLFDTSPIHQIKVDIFDLDQLEEGFMSQDIDLILTSKVPGRQKYRNLKEIGFQHLEKHSSNDTYNIFSPFEISQAKGHQKKNLEKIFVSNSLSLRRNWLSNYGGTGILPSEIKKNKGRELEPVLIIANDLFPPRLWEKLASFEQK